MRFTSKYIYAILLIAEAVLLLLLLGNTLDPDLGWRLRIGSELWDSKQLVRDFVGYNSEIFEATKGQFVDHQWLSNLLIYRLYAKYSYVSLWFVALAIILLTVWLAHKLLRYRSRSAKFIAISFFLFSFIPILAGFRLQYIIYPAALILCLTKKFVSSFWHRALIYIPLFIIGSNIHGGGFVSLLPALVLLELDSEPIKGRLWLSLKNAILALLVAVVSLSVNPYGFGFWMLALDYIIDSTYKINVIEWMTLYAYPIPALSLLVLPVVLIVLYKCHRSISSTRIALLVFFILFAIQSRRMLPLAVLFLLPEISAVYEGVQSRLVTSKGKKSLLLTTFFTLLLASFVMLYNTTLNFPAKDPFVISSKYPTKAIQSMDKTETYVLNYYDWGGYLVWTRPDLQIAIDGRAPQHKYKNGTILSSYLSMINDLPNEIDGSESIGALLLKSSKDRICSPIDSILSLSSCERSEANGKKLVEHAISNPFFDCTHQDGVALVCYRK